MSHKTMIDGVAYEISGGKTLIGGTAFSIKNGKTLVGGTAYEVGFVEMVTVTMQHTFYTDIWRKTAPYVVIDGVKYRTFDGDVDYFKTGVEEVEIEVGTEITLHIVGSTSTKEIVINGSVVAEADRTTTLEYPFVVQKNTSIVFTVDANYKVTITVTEE